MLTNTQRKTKLLAVNKDGRYKCKSQLYKHPFFELVIGHRYNLALVIAFGIALYCFAHKLYQNTEMFLTLIE